jgi:hypothetical protein
LGDVFQVGDKKESRLHRSKATLTLTVAKALRRPEGREVHRESF